MRRKNREFVSNYKNRRMNCRQCIREIDPFHDGTLAPDLRTQVRAHLAECSSCAGIYRLQVLIDKVVEHEKDILPDPFLATRIGARIENLNRQEPLPGYFSNRILRPVLITLSVAAAIFTGIIVGNLAGPSGLSAPIPAELTMINDAGLENIEIFSIE